MKWMQTLSTCKLLKNYVDIFSTYRIRFLRRRKVWHILRKHKKAVNEYTKFTEISTNGLERHFEGLFEELPLNQEEVGSVGRFDRNNTTQTKKT